MTEQTTYRQGVWQGQPAGGRVLLLITLGAPHHGMPSANESRVSGCLYRSGGGYHSALFPRCRVVFRVEDNCTGKR
jgi:hypothetical protein